jgi:DNA primase
MAGKIPQQFIDDLLERTDIVDVIDSRISLRKTGRNYSALCPFHKEKSPSFSVNPDKQFYYCFGCGAGGNAVSFLMDYERFDFPQAVESLAHSAGIEIPREQTNDADNERFQHNRDLYKLMEQADQYYQLQLRQHPKAHSAIHYLKDRGLTGIIAKEFGIGYAPPGWDNLLNTLPKDEREKNLLIEAGMIIDKEDGKRYDRFRERIMFPIRDNRGRIIGFGGRVLGDDKPKYLNSPETPIFHKSQELYGLYEARKQNRHLDKMIIVEGYMDVIALAQYGISYAVATLGTATSEHHIEKIFRQCSEVVFCFDGDKAGRAAADKALDTVLPMMEDGRQARFLFLPEGDDPDTLIRRESKDGFEQRMKVADTLSDYLFSSCSQDLDLNSMDARARFAKLALAKIQYLPKAGMLQQLMLSTLSDKTGLAIDQLTELTKNEIKKTESKLAEQTSQRKTHNKQSTHSAPQNHTDQHASPPSSHSADQPAEGNQQGDYSSEQYSDTGYNAAPHMDQGYEAYYEESAPSYHDNGNSHYESAPHYNGDVEQDTHTYSNFQQGYNQQQADNLQQDYNPQQNNSFNKPWNKKTFKGKNFKGQKGFNGPVERPKLPPGSHKLRLTPARHALTLLLNYPELAKTLDRSNLNHALEKSDHDSDLDTLNTLLNTLTSHPGTSSYALLGHWVGKPELELLAHLMASNISKDQETANIELQDCVNRLTQLASRQNRQGIISDLGQRKNSTLADLSPSEQAEFLKIFSKNRDK